MKAVGSNPNTKSANLVPGRQPTTDIYHLEAKTIAKKENTSSTGINMKLLNGFTLMESASTKRLEGRT